MSWPKNTPKSSTTVVSALEELIGSIEALESDHEEYRDNAGGRNDEDAIERHDQILEIIQSARDSLDEAVSQLQEWPTAG